MTCVTILIIFPFVLFISKAADVITPQHKLELYLQHKFLFSVRHYGEPFVATQCNTSLGFVFQSPSSSDFQ